MEIIEIQSVHNLATSLTHARPLGAHSYSLNCRQYLSTYHTWRDLRRPKLESFAVMTLEFRQIWITGSEGKKIADAIQAACSLVRVEDHGRAKEPD